MIKPRELGFLDNLIERSLKSDYPEISVNIESAIISWDKKKISFNINLYNIDISIPNKLESFTPHIILDISRRNLLLAKFTIDNAIFTGSEITLIKNPAIIEEEDKDKFTLSPRDIPVLFYNLELYSSQINIAENNFFIKELLFVKGSDLESDFISTKTTIKYNLSDIEVDFKCSISQSFLSECLGKISNVDNHFLAALTNNPILAQSNFSLNSKFQFDFNEKHYANIEIYSNNGNLHNNTENSITWDKLRGNVFIDFDNNNVALKNLYLSYLDNHLNFNGLYDISNNTITLELESQTVSKDYVMKFWPKSFAPRLNKWLTNQTNNLAISDAILNIELNTLTKKLNYLNLAFDFDKANITFSKKLAPLTNGNGNFLLENNLLKINLTKGSLKNIQIDSLTAIIEDALVKKPHNIIIDIKAKSDIANISEYLLKTNLGNLNLQGPATSYISLNAPIKPGTKLKDVIFDAKVNIDHFNFKYLMNDSKLQLSLNKSSKNDNLITTSINCLNCNAKIPIIEYDKNIIKSENFTFTVDATPKKIRIFDIQNYNLTNLKINANLIFNDQNKLASINISDSYIGKSDISLTYDNNSTISEMNISSDNAHISLKKLASIFSTEAQENKTNFTVIAHNIHLDQKLVANDLNITNYENKSKDIIHYLQLSLAGNKGSVIGKKKVTFLDDITTTDVTIHNLGLLLRNLDISSKVTEGLVTINTTNKNGQTSGKIFVSEVDITTNEFFQKIKEITSFGIKKSEYITSFRGSGDFSLQNNSILIDHFSCYSNNLGITTNGYIDLKNDTYLLDGVIIPATTLNTLLGIKNIPIIGNLVTGGKDEGLISASYKASGDLDKDSNIKINPFSTLAPGLLRKIFKLKISKKE
ncbi:MAG: hypothetical protein HOM96_01345 [Rickettsiales bacterium]|nr:hypothetical protein [Rickettsiales bacterium]